MNNLWLIFLVFSLPVMADDFVTTDIVNGCGEIYYFNAEFEPITYTCNSGQFLPAGATSCQACPQTHTCNGGTFTFNANQTQGLSDGDIFVTDAIGSCSTQFNQSFTVIFEPITYNCMPGYYLPAGNDWLTDTQGCTQCLANSYCSGGTYTFNETINQGITACPETHPISVAGASSINKCQKTLNWYNENTLLDSGTCNYNGLITLPTTPTRVGYDFNGWRLETK